MNVRIAIPNELIQRARDYSTLKGISFEAFCEHALQLHSFEIPSDEGEAQLLAALDAHVERTEREFLQTINETVEAYPEEFRPDPLLTELQARSLPREEW
jgi:hypothetical protein